MSRWWTFVPQGTHQGEASCKGWDEHLADVKAHAVAAQAILRTQVPVDGWVAENMRDRKWYPCKDGVRGAVRAWIWYGDI